MTKKDNLKADVNYLIAENSRLRNRLNEIIAENDRLTLKYEPYKPQKCGSVSFDFWPLGEWIRFSFKRWEPGQYAQLVIGPARFDWFNS